MNDIYKAVVDRLKTKRDPEDVLKLWQDLWSRFEIGSFESIEEYLETLVEYPED